jgi:hypothetical protein
VTKRQPRPPCTTLLAKNVWRIWTPDSCTEAQLALKLVVWISHVQQLRIERRSRQFDSGSYLVAPHCPSMDQPPSVSFHC